MGLPRREHCVDGDRNHLDDLDRQHTHTIQIGGGDTAGSADPADPSDPAGRTSRSRSSLVEVLAERCAGIDIGKDTVVACVRTPMASGPGTT
jgi:hypothetical protein